MILVFLSGYLYFIQDIKAADAEASYSNIDSLWSVWKNVKLQDTDRLNALDKICWKQYLFSKPDSAYYYANVIYRYATKINALEFQSRALNILGIYFNQQGEADSAVFYHKKGIAVAKRLNKNSSVAIYLNNLSNVELERGNYAASLDYIYQSLKISEKLKDNYLIAGNLSGIGNVYYELGDLDKALLYSTQSLVHAKKSTATRITKDILNNIGNIYSERENYAQSIPAYMEALEVSRRFDDIEGISGTLLNLGSDYASLKRYDSAMILLNESLQLMKELEDDDGVASIYNVLADIYYSKKDNATALKYAQQAYDIVKDEDNFFLLKNVTEMLYRIYKETNNTSDALKMYELYKAFSDSIINDDNHKALLRSQIQYEFDKKEEIVKEANRSKDLKLKRRAYTIGILTIIAFLSYIIYYLIIRQNKLIAAKKTVELEQKLLSSQINTHFTFNAVNSIQEFILNNQNEEAHYYLSEFAKLMRMSLTQIRKKNVSITDEISLLKTYILLEEQRLKHKINFNVINKNEVDFDNVQIPSMLLQPIIENSIWHGIRFQKNEKKVDLIFTKQEALLKIEIIDNGTGLHDELRDKTTSHGLHIVKERIFLLYDKKPDFIFFDIKNNQNTQGTVTTLIIPLVDEFE